MSLPNTLLPAEQRLVEAIAANKPCLIYDPIMTSAREAADWMTRFQIDLRSEVRARLADPQHLKLTISPDALSSAPESIRTLLQEVIDKHPAGPNWRPSSANDWAAILEQMDQLALARLTTEPEQQSINRDAALAYLQIALTPAHPQAPWLLEKAAGEMNLSDDQRYSMTHVALAAKEYGRALPWSLLRESSTASAKSPILKAWQARDVETLLARLSPGDISLTRLWNEVAGATRHSTTVRPSVLRELIATSGEGGELHIVGAHFDDSLDLRGIHVTRGGSF